MRSHKSFSPRVQNQNRLALQALDGLEDSSTFTFYAKMDPESAGGEGCPMGMAVLAQGFEDHTDMCPMLDDDDVEQSLPVLRERALQKFE